MTSELLISLSRDFLKLFETSSASDVSICAGEEPYMKTFNAHSQILSARSPYFAVALSSEWARRENGVIKFTKPNISPRVFEIVLRYLYSGEIALGRHGMQTLLEILIAADELCIEQLIDHIQTYLIENHAKSLEQSFTLVYQISFKFESFKKLQEYCTDFAAKNPEVVFKSADFASLKAVALLPLIQRDDLSLEEIEIWDYILKWGIAQNESLPETVSDWSAEDFQNLQLELQDLLPFIHFYHISSIDFYYKVKPYSQILPGNLYEDLLQHYLVPGSHDTDVRRAPRRSRFDSAIISSIMDEEQFSKIDKWISGSGTFDSKRYKLLLRGSRNGFTAQDFHRLCDNKGETVTIIKVKETGQIIGGYNPLSWDSSNTYQTDNRSFLFSLGTHDKENIIRSKHRRGYSTYNRNSYGPVFGAGWDLCLGAGTLNFQAEQSCRSFKKSYEHNIIDGAESMDTYFSVEEYEVFQVLGGRLK